MTLATKKVLLDIRLERCRQIEKWGKQNRDVCEWILILAEEFGEASKEANEVYFRQKDPLEYRQELVQTAAVCVAAIESLDRGFK